MGLTDSKLTNITLWWNRWWSIGAIGYPVMFNMKKRFFIVWYTVALNSRKYCSYKHNPHVDTKLWICTLLSDVWKPWQCDVGSCWWPSEGRAGAHRPFPNTPTQPQRWALTRGQSAAALGALLHLSSRSASCTPGLCAHTNADHDLRSGTPDSRARGAAPAACALEEEGRRVNQQEH